MKSEPARAACNNPNALGVARTLEIDTSGGPGFGFEHFKELDFLKDKEVVLTFDDGFHDFFAAAEDTAVKLRKGDGAHVLFRKTVGRLLRIG